jgi:hypothetical protein
LAPAPPPPPFTVAALSKVESPPAIVELDGAPAPTLTA